MPPITTTPSQPPEAFLGSRIPPPPTDALKEVESLIARLRAEAAGSDDTLRKARLLYEIGEIEERAADEALAARDYLAAFNADPQFREPVEGLLRLLERRRSLRNLGKLVDAVARAADTGDEEVRAKTLRAFFLEDVGGDAQAAKRAAMEATEVEGAAPAEAAMAWLALEMLAARVGDTETRARALAKRPDFAKDATWRGLLRLDAARTHAAAGEMDLAFEEIASARKDGAGATFAAAVAEERLASSQPGDGDDGGERDRRAMRIAEALLAQASLIEEALDDATRGDERGVPLWARTQAHRVDAWLRAADLVASRGDVARAGEILDQARIALATDEDTDAEALRDAVTDARIRIAERTGDTGLAAQLAETRLAGLAPDEDAGVVASLTMRVAEHAASEGDVPRALAALARAVQREPLCVPARALQLDLLADEEPGTFAAQLESLAEHLPTEDGRGRALLLAAWVWGARTGDAAAARAALVQASASGVPGETIARAARTLASLTNDAGWYEEATRRLLATEPTEEERPMLWLEVARARFGRGDDAGGRAALREIGASAQGAWLGRALEAFLPASGESPADEVEARARKALDELAARPQPDDVARGLVLMAAIRAHKAGDVDGAQTRLRDLVAKRPDDILATTYLAELERSRGALDEVAKVATAAAEAATDPELASSLRLEAGLSLWRRGDRAAAIAAIEEAVEAAPDAARAVLSWAARGVDVDSLDARRRAIARALDAGGDEATLMLERFAVEIAAGDAAEASAALVPVDASEDASVALAAALARAAWSLSDGDEGAMSAALARIAGAGPEASAIAAGEEHRRALASNDADRVLDAARAWFTAGGGLTAGVEWLAAAMAQTGQGGDIPPDEEQAARRALLTAVTADLREPLLAGSAMLHAVTTPDDRTPLLNGESDAVRLVNLELAPPGCDPRRRIAALRGVDGALGPDAEADALGLSGWSWLALGNAAEALLAFERAAQAHEDDLASWEGLRTAAESAGDTARRAAACEALGTRCKDDARAGGFWEQAGLACLELGDAPRAEAAFFQAFARDATRTVAFDKLFRRVRERKEGDLLLELVGRRLSVCDEPAEIAKLFWEQARVLREKGDQDAALKALENVTMLEPDHVGALALTGEIAIRRGKFEEAATALARLALLENAPAKNRLTAGVAATDLFENKLGNFDKALEILLALHRAKLSSLPVRERLARAAARTGSWKEATAILEELMHERPEAEGRVEAARLAMAIHRDRLNDPNGAVVAVVKLLEEAPIDGEGIEMLLAIDVPDADRTRLLENAKKALVETLQRRIELPAVRRLAKVARALNDETVQQIALSAAIVLGGHDAGLEQQFAQVVAKKPRTPQMALTESILKQVLDPGDRGPIAKLFMALGPTIAEALGPSLAGCGVTKKDRVDPRSGIALRNEIAAWAGAFGITEFDLYVGGKDPLDVQGVPGDVPSLVVGAGVNAPLAPATRARVARELLAMVRGSTITRHRDDTTIAAIVVAACNLAEVKLDAPSYAVLADVERLLAKAISRKTKKLLPDLCKSIVASNADARSWAKRALSSHARVAAIASGDVGIVLADALGEPLDKLQAIAKTDPRAEELLRFALSPTYSDLRRALGLEGERAMSGGKDKDLDLGSLDWDDALAEWEEKAFVPEPAKDRETESPGTLQGTPIPPPIASAPAMPVQTKPLYMPTAGSGSARPDAKSPTTRPPKPPSVPAAARPAFLEPEIEGDESGATVVSVIPRELLRKESERAPRSTGGGLGQMFARTSTGSERVPQPAEDLENAPTATHAPESQPPDDAVFTSAQQISPTASRAMSDAPPRRRGVKPDPHASTPDGELFDPFAEPDPFQQGKSVDAIPVIEGTPNTPIAKAAEEISVPIDVSPGPPLHQPTRRAFDPDLDTNAHVRGAIHAPTQREYDPNEETSMMSKAALRVQPQPPDEDGEDPTHLRSRADALPPKQTISWADEKPAGARIEGAARQGFSERAEWFEAEARAADDRTARARALLAASEIRAMLGENDAAEILAGEAAATAPSLAMASRQSRALTPSPRDAAPLADALDAEGRQSPTQAGRLHAALFAADVLRRAGDAAGAAKRWDQAVRISPSDPRAPIARAADRLARGDLGHATLRLPDAPELAQLGVAFARALKIRGVTRPDLDVAEPLANDGLRRAREAIDARNAAQAARAIAELGRVPELRDAASWLAASFASVTGDARAESVDWLRIVGKNAPGRLALAARALELGAADVVEEACAQGQAFSAADRAVLAMLAGVPQASSDEDLDSLSESEEMRPLAAALAAVAAPKRRPERSAGTTRARSAIRLARLVAADAPADAIEQALAPFDGDHDGETRAVALEMAARAGRFGDVSDAIAGWSDDDEDGARDRSLAAAVVAERSGDAARAIAAYTSARAFDPANEAALRALASLDSHCDVGAELRSLGDARGEGAGAAMAWLEAVARGGADLGDDVRAGLLEAAHRAAPGIPIAAFVAERSARRAGDVESVLRWIRERRAATAAAQDPVQAAIDDVVEALLIADGDAAQATERLAAAHLARPADVTLRELYERVAAEPPSDRATWRETRAAAATSRSTRARLHLDAAREHEQAGDRASALRAAASAYAEDPAGLAGLTLERAELASGAAARLADALLATARGTEDLRTRREAYERLADLDATGRDDAASALLWHKTILEEQPSYAPSLRYVEHALLTDGRIDELEPISAAIARALLAAKDTSPETSAHAELAARLRMRGPTGEWAPTREMVELAASLPEPSLWSLRALAAHARAAGDEGSIVRVSLALADRTTRSPEIAALVVRAGEAALRAEDLPNARTLLERAATEDPGDVVTWGLLADVRQRAGDTRGAAEACESLARTSVVDEHRILAWYDAGRLWLDEVDDPERGIAALEQAAAIDLSFQDVFGRLSALYTQRGARAELAGLLERRIAIATDDEDRVRMEVDRARALLDVGETQAARRGLEAALETRPDHVVALSAYAELCASIEDWEAAEQTWVRLARLVPEAHEQRAVYEKLGELYSEHAPNYARAEVALKEVLKRAPDDVPTLERLVEVYKHQNDGARALEVAQQLLKMAPQPEDRRARLVLIATIHETTTKDLRKAEQALESARREFPNDVGALRALAEFYQRQRQMPAMNILLDRASADARRALAAGRFSPSLFEVLKVVHELRGKRDAARVAAATLAALEGHDANVPGAGGRAGDPRLDDLLAPDAVNAGLRAMLARAGDALDIASALDLRALHAQPLGPGVAQSRIAAIASSLGIPPVQVLVSPQLGKTCVPSASAPPCIVLGEPLVGAITEPAAAFAITRALKLVQAHASALVRTPPADLAVLVAAWLTSFNPAWKPQGVAPGALENAKRRLAAGIPRSLDPEVATIALEVAGTLGPHLATLGSSTIAWGDRVALLAVGDPNAALDGIAWSVGMNDGAPKDPERRTAWVLHTAEARDLLAFSTGDAFAEARTKAGITS